MKKKILFSVFIIIGFWRTAVAQSIGIGTAAPNPSAMLEVQSANKGLLIPRVVLLSETDVVSIPNSSISLLVYNLNFALPAGAGYYYWSGTKWNKIIAKDDLNNVVWGLKGNSGTTPPTDFIGTTDNTPLVFKTFNNLAGKLDYSMENATWGKRCGNSLTTGTKNFLAGTESGSRLTTGERNVFIGYYAGNNTQEGSYNIAIGNEALKINSNDPFLNNYIAIGNRAGHDVEASASTTNSEFAGIFIGTAAGYHGPSGIAIGDSASNQYSDYRNIAIGVFAMKDNTAGPLNIGIGYKALMVNTNGEYNLALGHFAMIDNTTGTFNIAIGNNALDENISGNNNTAIGSNAGFAGLATNLNNTTTVGHNAWVSTSNTMVFGDQNVDRWAFGISTTNLQHALEVGFGPGNGNGAFLTQGGTWTNTSSRAKKEDFTEVNGADLIQKLKALPIQKWKYINTDEYHIGPVAEDFYDLFGLGTDDKGISTVDPAGISLAAIKELIKQTEELIKENESMRNEMKSMKAEIAQLKKGIK